MNLPDMKWYDDRFPGSLGFLEEFLNKWLLVQQVFFPTRFNPDNVLDLIFTNNDSLIEKLTPDIVCTNDDRLSDHALIYATLNSKKRKTESTKTTGHEEVTFDSFAWFKCTDEDWKRLNEIIITKDFNDQGSPDQNLSKFYTNMLDSCKEANMPTKSTKNQFSNKFKQKRRTIFRKMKRKKYQTKLQQLHQELKCLYDEERQSEEQKAVKCIKKNPKYFYQYVKSHCGKREAVATLKNSSGDNIENDKEKADALAEQYSSVFSNLPIIYL